MIVFPERHPWWLRYAVAALSALVGSLLTWIFILNGLKMHSSFMLTAVVIAAWFGGFRPGMLAVMLTIPGQILLREPVYLWRIDGIHGWVGFLIYLMNSLVICFVFRKRYLQKSRTSVSPVAVTGGWMWKFDQINGGVVETHSPLFPHLSVTRTFSIWLQTVHPDDREVLQRQIKQAFADGTLATTYHLIRDDGEVRRVSMFGVAVHDSQASQDYLVATCLEVGAHEDSEHLAWQSLPLG